MQITYMYSSSKIASVVVWNNPGITRVISDEVTLKDTREK